ncbi:3-hydroxyacyl-[acyl-carrier-protein] dehydratase [Psychromonas ingrahamii 37]|uniref:3-hydroxyacyl-[acyl-carrier-protein] dehydratase FabZ n=1 Tax=Psychromonas ingrahamii (strain DSM 17664 / CCUG 51855 / 37) TaxID=357804 RepID=FABZ_PSYIN|nr:3-hydroxyacyl-ACP dehydratase FabZ [Psychromonas ingrahamii]A1SYV2.1 RecName: Full=3-hydroxyacyl-[acyl-carrier-protein] dehydratase FabZ; AltName: Full=(3R)-hydroxymyristoyl-[acyl-carrier-protein] dehydratase; Short=(3R)-hydroxymyristoyl-ACP dehydrase; AltName: Full=Beta-hydroxyacyl-ACP dehydratase [Psychromonas ingrahamii 37]ABM04667.1 3-hydroxyacyl-[acyl-carrier-protein] dehydratase [Psychromonas ingrahamii 37]
MTNELNSLDIKEIMDLLPHRYPFLLVDRVLDYVPGKRLHGIKNISFNEPQFTGHFPDTPIYPGVMILESLAQATGVLAFATYGKPAVNELYFLASMDKVRFRRPVIPGDVLDLEVIYLKDRRGMGKFECVAKVDGQVACEAMIMCARREI